jgi:hypothetical protein
MTCTNKKTKYQPTRAQWRCPSCNDADAWIVHWTPCIDCNCRLLHDDDHLICDNCRHERSGESFAEWAAKDFS